MPKKVLTERFIKSRKPAAPGKRDDYHDAVVPGLALRVTDKGAMSFVLHGRFPARPGIFTRRTLGGCYLASEASEEVEHCESTSNEGDTLNGVLTLSEARQKARQWLDMIGRGVDPKIESARQRALVLRRQVNTFGAVADHFIARHVKGPSNVEIERMAERMFRDNLSLSMRDARLAIERDPQHRILVARAAKEGIAKKNEAARVIQAEFVKRWGYRPIGDILPEEVAAAIRAIVSRGAPYQAHNAFGYLRRLFNWAIGTNEFGITTSPVERLRPSDLIGKRESRERVLSDGEVREVWAAAKQMGYPYGPLFQILLLTGQREREVSEMRWEEIDFPNLLWTIPTDRMKGRRSHEVPLSAEAASILEVMPKFKAGSYVFTTTDGTKPVNGFSKTKVRIGKLIRAARIEAGNQLVMADWVIHDLRRTVRTHLSSLPVDDMVRELVIAHVKPGLHKVYDQHTYRDEKRRCLVLWSEKLKIILAVDHGE